MDLTLLVLISTPVLVLAGLAIPHKVLIVALGYASSLFVKLAIFNALPVYSLIGGLVSWMRVRRVEGVNGLRTLTRVLVIGGLVALMSAVWSPEPLDAMSTSLRWLALAPLVILAVNVLQENGYAGISTMLACLAPLALAQAGTTILFRLNPGAEDSYYQSGLGRFFLGEGSAALFTEAGWNNVRELDRAGGFLFVSVNRASLVMGVMFLVYFACWAFTRRAWPLLVAGALAVAIVLGGSKTGLVLLIVLPVFALAVAAVSSRRNAAGRIGLLLGALVAAVVALNVFVSTADEFVSASSATLVPRYTLWGEAARAMAENPIVGLGFGGWEARWGAGQVAANFSYRPAHNWFLQAWLDGGILYATMNIALVITVLILMLRAVSTATTVSSKRVFALMGSAFLWAFIHGNFDNTELFGDSQGFVFLAIAAAAFLVGIEVPDRTKSSRVQQSRSRRSTPQMG